jgi:hypothetical protein
MNNSVIQSVPQFLIRKLALVQAEVDHHIPKRGRNEFHKYDYAMEADIVSELRKGLSDRHILLVPHVLHVERVALGEKNVLTVVDMRFTFMDGETGESLTIDWQGTGSDPGDKGLYKAMTGAEKYVLLKTFLIPTGDDPEQDDEQPAKPKPAPGRTPTGKVATTRREPPPDVPTPPASIVTNPVITNAQVTRLRSLLKTHNVNIPEFKAWVLATLKAHSAEEILRSDYDRVTQYIVGGGEAPPAA